MTNDELAKYLDDQLKRFETWHAQLRREAATQSLLFRRECEKLAASIVKLGRRLDGEKGLVGRVIILEQNQRMLIEKIEARWGGVWTLFSGVTIGVVAAVVGVLLTKLWT